MEYILSKKYDTPELQALIMGPNPVKLEEELLLSWHASDASGGETRITGAIVSRSTETELLELREMESNEEVWADWLRQDNEYAAGDRRAMEAGGGKYLNFIKIVLRKK